MRCEPLNGSLSAEESVEPISGQAEFLSGRLRLCTWKAQPGAAPGEGIRRFVKVQGRCDGPHGAVSSMGGL